MDNDTKTHSEDVLRQQLYSQHRTELLDRHSANSQAYDSALLTMSSALLGVSIAFITDIAPKGAVLWPTVICASWVALALCVLVTIINFLVANRQIDKQLTLAHKYYLQKDDSAFRGSGEPGWVDHLNELAGVLFVLGLILTVAFASVNFVEGQKVNTKNSNNGTAGFAEKPTPAMAHDALRPVPMAPTDLLSKAIPPTPMQQVQTTRPASTSTQSSQQTQTPPPPPAPQK